jgi:uncharacterized protein (DUF983 family)
VAAAPPWQAALRCRCSLCGVGRLYGKLYDELLTVRPTCTECGLDLTELNIRDREDTAVILRSGATIFGVILLVESWLHPPLWVRLLLVLSMTISSAILIARPLKAALIAQRYRHRAAEVGL